MNGILTVSFRVRLCRLQRSHLRYGTTSSQVHVWHGHPHSCLIYVVRYGRWWSLKKRKKESHLLHFQFPITSLGDLRFFSHPRLLPTFCFAPLPSPSNFRNNPTLINLILFWHIDTTMVSHLAMSLFFIFSWFLDSWFAFRSCSIMMI